MGNGEGNSVILCLLYEDWPFLLIKCRELYISYNTILKKENNRKVFPSFHHHLSFPFSLWTVKLKKLCFWNLNRTIHNVIKVFKSFIPLGGSSMGWQRKKCVANSMQTWTKEHIVCTITTWPFYSMQPVNLICNT